MFAFPRRRSQEIPADPSDAAVYWTARRRLGTVSPENEAAFQAWLADPGAAQAYTEADGPIEAAGELAGLPEILDLRKAALAAAPARPRRSLAPRLAGAGLVAAGLAGIAVFGGVKLAHPPARTAAAQLAASAPAGPAVKVYATGVGERLNVALEDGSTAELNTASRLEVAYKADRRDLKLIRGEAMFQVARNKARPFVVAAGDRQITATGTAFDVRIDGPRVKVVLVEGHVVVEPLTRTGLQKLVPPPAQELSAGEQLTASPAGQVSVEAADLDRAGSWRRGQLIFRDDTLKAAATEFNRYTATQLVVDDPSIAGLKISGVFGSASSDNFVAAITTYFPVDAEMRATGTLALVRRPGTLATVR